MPTSSTQLKSRIPDETLRDVLDGKFDVHLNAADLFKTLNELSRIPNERLHLKSFEINHRINEYIRLNLINNIFKYFTQTIDRNKQSLDDNLKTLLLEFCNNFLIACSNLTTTGNNHQKIFDNYFTFLNSLCKISKIHDITFEENHDAFSLITLSDGLLKRILTSNSTHTTKSVTHFFSALGHLAFNLGLEHHENEGYISTIDQRVVSFYNAAKASADLAVLGNAVYTYAYISKDNNTEEAKQHCQDLIHEACLAVATPTVMPITTVVPEVMRTESRVERTTRASYHPKNVTLSSNNSTKAANHTTISSTTLLSAEAMRTETEIEPTTRTPYAQTNATLPFHDRTQNETGNDATLIPSNYPIPSTPELIAAAGHGIVNGVINAVSQQLSERSTHKPSRIPVIALNLATILLHSGYAATLPLILASLQNSDVIDENAKDEMWERIILQVIPSFFTNLGFGLGFQLLNHYQAHYLSDFPTVKAAVQSIPVVSTAYAAISAPISTAVNIGAATASSLLTKTAFNFFSSAPKKKVFESSIETAVEVPLIKNLPNNSQEIVKVPAVGSKTFHYIAPDRLTAIITLSNNLQTTLDKLIALLKQNIQDNGEKAKSDIPSSLSTTYQGIIDANKKSLKFIEPTKDFYEVFARLNDNCHKEACETHTDKDKYFAAMEKLGNVFKLIQDSCNKMKIGLSSAQGFINGKLDCFDENNSPVSLITELTTYIRFLLDQTSLYLNKYNTASAGYKGEVRGALKAGLLNNHSKVTILRSKNNGENTVQYATNRRNTVDYYSTTSEESRTSECDPIEPQQEQPLLKP